MMSSVAPFDFQARFARQTRYAQLGPAGQARLGQRRVLLVGCGALGGVLAQTLVRAGVGALRICDRDLVEESNLPRQVLFDARHAAERMPKVEAALESLLRIGGPTEVEPHAVQVGAENLPELAAGCDLILDGTDNLATRYLINDFSVASDLPWIYAGAVGSEGVCMTVLPGRGPCLRCLFPEPAPAGSLPTCESAGVLLPAVAAIASLQAGAALRLLSSPDWRDADLPTPLLRLDAWAAELQRLEVGRDPDCPCCGAGRFEFLEQATAESAVVLCGRNTVQLPASPARPDVDALARRLEQGGTRVVRAGHLLRFAAEDCSITVFPDGRALIEGTDSPERAQALFDRYAS